MKLLEIGTTDKTGGAANISWTLKNSLELLGHQVTMFVADKKSDDANVKVIKRSRWRKLLGFLLGTERLISTDWLLETEEFKQADVIHCHNLHGRFFNLNTLQKMSERKPIVWTLHDEWAITPHCACTMQMGNMKYGLFVCPSIDTPPRTLWNNDRALAREKISVYRRAKLNLVTPSLWLKERVEKTVLREQPIYYIPNGINTTIFKPLDKTECRKALKLPLDKKIVLFLADNARQNIWKGWPYAENLARKYAGNDGIVFVSVGNYNSSGSGLNIINRGHIASKQIIAQYYNAADMLLFTSLAENLPLVILEAMACGLPIVSFDVGGVKEVVTTLKNGYIARYRDEADLEAGMKEILSFDDSVIARISKDSVEKIRSNYDEKQMVKRYLALYSKLLSSN